MSTVEAACVTRGIDRFFSLFEIILGCFRLVLRFPSLLGILSLVELV